MNYTPAPHVTQNWSLSKPSASGKRGMVVSQARAAAEAGVAILDAGGNAIDAAVATALSLAAVEPWNSGLGGIGFALIHRAGESRADVVDFGPVAPRGLVPSAFKLTGRIKRDYFPWPEVENDANIHGPLSFAIPSSVAGYAKMHGTWGKLPFAEVVSPAVALSERGLPQDWFTTLKVAASAAILKHYPESARVYLPGGMPPIAPYQGAPGFFRLGNLPATLERLARAGARDFYEGEIAASIVADVSAMGGVLTAQDLRDCEARIVPATEYTWRGRTLQLTGGLTAAPTMMRVLDRMASVPHGGAPDAAWFVAFARAMKTAYGERLEGLGDADPLAAETCTSHLTVCDRDGTMVLLNNGVMWFDPRPHQPNSIAGGKRPLTNMSPIVLEDGNRPWLAAGASGGRRILAAVAQVMTFIADFGMTVEQAAHHPRIDVSGPEGVAADRRLPADVIAALSEDGPTELLEHGVSPINFACPNVLVRDPEGNVTGISDVASPWSAAVAQA